MDYSIEGAADAILLFGSGRLKGSDRTLGMNDARRDEAHNTILVVPFF